MCELVAERAAANLPQTAQSALFTISGGRVLIVDLLGEVTTAVQNQANTTKVVFNPTVGADRDLCSGASIADVAVGTYFAIDPQPTALGGLQTVIGFAWSRLAQPITLGPGTVDLNCAASNTGQVKWRLAYVPLDPGARVEAA